MALRYFHYANGSQTLDNHGTDLADVDAVRKEALRAVRELLNLRPTEGPWDGDPWRVWVTDQPNAGGKTILTVELSAR